MIIGKETKDRSRSVIGTKLIFKNKQDSSGQGIHNKWEIDGSRLHKNRGSRLGWNIRSHCETWIYLLAYVSL